MTIGADAITFIVRDLICAISLCSCICVTGQLWNMSVELLVAVHIRLFVERAFSCLRKNDNEESFFFGDLWERFLLFESSHIVACLKIRVQIAIKKMRSEATGLRSF